MDNNPASTAISLTSIRGVELGEYPSSAININIQGKTMYEFNPIVPNRALSQSWCVAIQSAMKLQDICTGINSFDNLISILFILSFNYYIV